MSGIFGIWRRDGAPVAELELASMRMAMADWGRDGFDLSLAGPIGAGQAYSHDTPEARHGRLTPPEANGGVTFVSAGRVDNRADLTADLGMSSAEAASAADGEILRRAHARWGDACTSRVHGDWAFAAWDPRDDRLCLARDASGNTALYAFADARRFAFASSARALLALPGVPRDVDELYLAQVLVSWTAYHGSRTIHRAIRRVPPAHRLVVTSGREDLQCYWRLEETEERRLPRPTDYVEPFRAVFDEAVRARLRSDAPVGAMLSGGLDSGAVVATASRLLQGHDRLRGFTSVPLSDPRPYVGNRFGDELALARATADFVGRVDVEAVAAADVSPLDGIREGLRIHGEPTHAAGNLYWRIALQRAARDRGCRVLLTGQLGNGGVSWIGERKELDLGLLQRLKERIRPAIPASILRPWQRFRRGAPELRHSAIQPDFAARIRLVERRLDDPGEWPSGHPRDERIAVLMPGRSMVGALHAQMGAAHGLEVRDPTGDARVLAFCLSVPDAVFGNAATIDRWLIREAMDGRLPDAVRLNRQRGRQAGDLVVRLRKSAAQVDAALDALARGPARAYVDVPRLREAWALVKRADTSAAFRRSMSILTRGLMAGLFVNDLEAGGD